MTRRLHPTMRGPDGEPVEVADVVLEGDRLRRRQPDDPPAAKPPVRVVTLAEALERQRAAGGIHPLPLPPGADLQAHAAELARLEYTARSEQLDIATRAAEIASRIQAESQLAVREAVRAELDARFPSAIGSPPGAAADGNGMAGTSRFRRTRAKSVGDTPASAFGQAGAAQRNRQQWGERERCIQMVARLWPEVREAGLRPGWRRWTPARASRAIGARWPKHYPERAEDTLRSYVVEAQSRGLIPTF